MIELESPAANIVGFEHQPRDKDQRNLVKQAITQLKQPQQLFEFDTSAQCSLDESEVDTDLSTKHQHHHDHKHDKVESSHSDFQASYSFSCDQIDRLKSIRTNLFAQFERMEKIKVQTITPNGQHMKTLTPSQNVIEF